MELVDFLLVELNFLDGDPGREQRLPETNSKNQLKIGVLRHKNKKYIYIHIE